jgi:hypothetical protein
MTNAGPTRQGNNSHQLRKALLKSVSVARKIYVVMTVMVMPVRYFHYSYLHLIGKDEMERIDGQCQMDDPNVAHKPVQTVPKSDVVSPATEEERNEFPPNRGTKENPLNIDDDEEFNPHRAVSDDEPFDTEKSALQPSEEDKFFFGSIFAKVEEFDRHLDDRNPFHPDLAKPLFPSQIIGFRWMLSRHGRGGGLIGDKVGCGKVLSQARRLILTTDIPSSQFCACSQGGHQIIPP